MKVLTEEQVLRYRENGYLFPIPALNPSEAVSGLANLERVEAKLGAPLTSAERKYRHASYTYLPWVDALVRHPRILDVIEDIIGPDILVFTATFFIKESATKTFAAWHQDATYFGLQPYEHVTAWVALSDASKQAGCMDVLSFKGAQRQMRHTAAGLENSINAAGQVIVDSLDDSNPISMELSAGELSLHHTLCPHRSGPNRSPHRRVGLGISYIPPHVRTTGPTRMHASLVRGADNCGNFELLPSPQEEMSADALAVHAMVHARYREYHVEQQNRHAKEFANVA